VIGAALRQLIAPFRRLHGRLSIGAGQFQRSRPLSGEFGYDRGTPIDRLYIEDFLETHATDIRGRVLEIGDDVYSRRFGGSQVIGQDILHAHAGNSKATIVGDLADAATLPSDAFDCIILTQTLHLVFDMATAVRELHRALRPGGTLLITVPGISPVIGGEWQASWYWSLTENALKRLLSGPFDPAQVSLRTYGNLFAATAFLHGACVEEVGREKLDPFDERYPVTVAAKARRS
jgi:SAM-dependent methyltransferase